MSEQHEKARTTAARLTGRVAVVTGAGGGIGRATSQRLAAEGACVLAVDIDKQAAQDTVDAVAAAGGTATAHVADLADRQARAGVVPAALEQYAHIDVLVNNAAYQGQRRPFLDMPPDEWDDVLAVNLTASAALCQDAARHMADRGTGAIVNMTAIQERFPLATHTAYGVSKGGVSALTRSLAVELSPLGIRVNAVAPGMIATPHLQAILEDTAPDERRQQSTTLLGRDGTPDELASAVAFLASDDASFITGVVLTVDGGRTLSRRYDPLAAQHDPDPTQEG